MWFAATYYWRSLPIWALVALGGVSVAWQMSLQHEIIHNHPTHWRRLNRAIGAWPLSLWLPFDVYRITHLQHHNDNRLTDPLEDPESYYYTSGAMAGAGTDRARAFARAIHAARAARARAGLGDVSALGRRDQRHRARQHQTPSHPDPPSRSQVTLVLAWVIGVCRMPFWLYFWAFVYAGTALALVRSFAEHRAEDDVERRTAIVERSWLLGPLFLFNNLHVVHHLRAGLPWYELPRWYRMNRAAVLERNGGLVYRSYLDVAWRYLFKPHDAALHPKVSAEAAVADQIPAYQS